MTRHGFLPIWICVLLLAVSCATGPEKGEAEYTPYLRLSGAPPVGLRTIAFDMVGDLRNYEPVNYYYEWSGSMLDSILAEHARSDADTLILSRSLRVNAGRYQVSAWVWGLADTLDSDSSSTRVLARTQVYLRSDALAGDLIYEGSWPSFSQASTAR